MFKFLFLFIAIPLILITVVDFLWIFQNSTVYEITTNPALIKEGLTTIPTGYVITGTLIIILYLFFYFFATAGITSMSVQKKKYKVPEITKVAKASWIKYLGFVIVYIFFLILLFLLFIIPGIIFMVYWTFAVYIFFYEKDGILVSLQKSKQLVKGNWWRTFGYLLLLILIVSIIEIILFTPISITEALIKSGEMTISTTYIVLSSLYELITNFISVLMYSFLILFFKNFYFALKNKK